MPTIAVKNFEEWRDQARDLLKAQIPPVAINWIDATAQQCDLFEISDFKKNNSSSLVAINVPKRFIQLAEKVAAHRNNKRWALLYSALWRLHQGEKALLNLSTDELISYLFRMEKAVNRDMHKMKAFVRFQLFNDKDLQHYIAWYVPDHRIVRLVANFFRRRFSLMRWTIFTPDESVTWDGEKLHFGEGVEKNPLAINDETEQLWLTYYRSIFNPNRIKLKAMRQEMPVRYWPTLPETKIIPSMLQEAPQRINEMLKHTEGFSKSAADFMPENFSLDSLRISAAACHGCSLYRCAKQTVFGEGPVPAEIMMVGEQPGEQEDLIGSPFVGPAGKILDLALIKAGIDRKNIYLTNAVKHFKNKFHNGKRLHVSPSIHEINACNPWLEAEITLVQPKLIICLGRTAARALISHGFSMKELRGQWLKFRQAQRILVTYHPSAVCRAVTEKHRQEILQTLIMDLQTIKIELVTQ